MKIVSRRVFLTGAVRGAALGGFYLAFGDVAPLLARRRILHWTAAGAADDPFTIVSIGDGIMWGQGLSEESKFTARIATWFKEQFPGRGIAHYRYAHAGAVIRPNAQKDAQPPNHGEVPNSYPSISYQVETAKAGVAPRDVHLVLVNGGINDVKLGTILTTDPSITDKIGRIREQTRLGCAEGLRLLLPSVLQSFPRAKVVVTSYYPMISDQTRVDALGTLVNLYNPTRPLAGPAPDALQKALGEQSRAFHDEYVSTVRPVVVGAAKPGATTAPRRTAFAIPPFAPENCYGAPDSWLWNAGEPDPAGPIRRLQCELIGHSSSEPCKQAQVGHPNGKGAAAYARAVIAQLETFLPDWRTERTAAQVSPPAPALPTGVSPPVRR